jgi:hypothetical protein
MKILTRQQLYPNDEDLKLRKEGGGGKGQRKLSNVYWLEGTGRRWTLPDYDSDSSSYYSDDSDD